MDRVAVTDLIENAVIGDQELYSNDLNGGPIEDLIPTRAELLGCAVEARRSRYLRARLQPSSPRCMAQEVVNVIYLSAGEAAKAKQLANDLKAAQDRNSRATAAWQGFFQGYQAAHRQMGNLRFSSDFRFAFTRTNSSPVAEAAVVELSAEERRKAESSYREMLESRRALDQAQKGWPGYQKEVIADHVSGTGPGSFVTVTLPSGKSVIIPAPWTFGAAFTPDFRVAVPVMFILEFNLW